MAESITKEIVDATELLHARRGAGASGDTVAPLQRTLASGIVGMIQRQRAFTTSIGASLMAALPIDVFGEEGTASIRSAIEARIGASQASVANTAIAKHDGQRLLKPGNFLTQSDWDFIRDKRKSFHAKQSVVIHRFNLLGVRWAHEQTMKWALALLLVAHFPELPSYPEIFKLLHDFKHAVDTMRKESDAPYLIHYPPFPAELPEEIRRQAYDDADPPVSVHLEGMDVVADNHIPMRKNSKLLRSAPTEAPTGPNAPITWGALQSLLRGDSEPAVHMFDRRGRPGGTVAGLRAVENVDPFVGAGRAACAIADGTDRDHRTIGRASPYGRSGVDTHVRGRSYGDKPALEDAPGGGADDDASHDDAAVDPPKATAGAKSPNTTIPAKPPTGKHAEDDGLGAYEQAAIAALSKRELAKKEEAAMRKKPSAAGSMLKRPAGRPAGTCCTPKPSVRMTKAQILKVLPKPPHNPVEYNGARIHIQPSNGFLIKPTIGEKLERVVGWKGEPTRKHWLRAIEIVDAVRAAGDKKVKH